MQLGIFARTFARPAVDQVFAAAAATGVHAVQMNMSCAGLAPMPDAVPDAMLRDIAEGARRQGIRLAALSGTFNMIHPDREERRAGQRRLATLIHAARALDIGIVTLCTGTRDPDDQWRRHPDNDRPEAWADLIDALGSALPVATAEGIVLAFEPERANVVDSAAKARALLDEVASPQLKVLFDPANLVDESATAALRDAVDEGLALLGPDIVLAHAKDRNAQGRPCAPGRGEIDFRHYLAGLAAVGYAGAVVMHGFDEPDAASAVVHMRGALAALQ